MSLRHPPTPVLFVDRQQQAEHELDVERARDRQPTRYAVAPRFRVSTIDGRLLEAGQPVTAADFAGGPTPGWRILERHVRGGRVLERHGIDDGPEAA